MFVICGTASAVLLTFVFLMLMNVFAYLSKFENSINFEIMFQKNIPGGRGSKRF